ncbi:MAG: PD40 domain-containing protein [Caldilineaceae bacterium]|nr:PD40 domain-containing protein [Caldilineaceae bacterium]
MRSQPLNRSFAQFLLGLTFVKSTDGREFVSQRIQPPANGDLHTLLANREYGEALAGLIKSAELGGLWAGVDGVVLQDGVAISPDGKQVVFSLDSGTYADLYVTNLDGTEPRRLTDNMELGANRAANPWWSPLDARIFFDQQVAGVQTATAIQSDGTELEPLWPGGYRLRLSSDGRKILYNVPAGSPNGGAYMGDLFSMESTQVNAEPLLAEWSPDGRQIAFERTSHLFVRAMADATERKLVTANMQGAPLWSPTGNQIAFGSLDNSLHVARADGLGSINLTGAAHTSPVTPLLWSPDGRYVLYRALAEGIYVIDIVSGEKQLLLALAETDLIAAVFSANQNTYAATAQNDNGAGKQTRAASDGGELAVLGRMAGILDASGSTLLGIPIGWLSVAAALLLGSILIFSLRNLAPGMTTRNAAVGPAHVSSAQPAASDLPMATKKPQPPPAQKLHPFHQLDTSGTLAQHGPEIPDQALLHQLQTGVAPDGSIRPVRAATRFASYEGWLSTRQAALHELQRQAQMDGMDLSQPPPGQPDRRKITLAHGRYIGDGFVGQGKTATRMVGGQPVTVYGQHGRLAGIAQTTTTIRWNPETRQWEIDQHYPDANKKLGITVTT